MKTLLLPVVGLLVGVGAAFTGLGGGFLVVPLLVFLGYTPQHAVGTSFMAILVISLSALAAHGRFDHVDWKTGILLGIGGILGAQIGAKLVQQVSAPVFNKIFAAVLVLLAIQMVVKK